MSHTTMIVPPFLVSEICPYENHKKILYAPLLSSRYIYLHETLYECVSSKDNVSHIIMITFRFSVLRLWPFDCFMLILCKFYSCRPYNSVTVWDTFIKFDKKMNWVKKICGVQE